MTAVPSLPQKFRTFAILISSRLGNRNSILQGAALSVLGSGGNRALQIASLLVVATRFGPRDLSMVSMVVLWGTILGLALAPGFSLPLTGVIAGARARKERTILPLLMLLGGSIITVIIAVGVIWGTTEIAPVGLSRINFVLLLSVMATGYCVQALALSGLIAEQAYRLAMGSSLTLGASQCLAPLVAPNASTTIVFMAVGALIAAILSTSALVYVARASDKGAVNRFSKWQVTLGRIPPSLIGSSVVEPTNLIILTYIFAKAHPPINTAVITVAQQWLSLLLFIPAIANQLILPRLMHYVESGNFAVFRHQSRVFTMWNAALVSLPAGFLLLGSPILLSAYRLEGLGYPFMLLICAGWLAAMCAPFGTVINGLGEFKLNAIGNAFWSAVFFSTSLILVHRSTDGFAESRSIAYFMFLIALLVTTSIKLKNIGPGGNIMEKK